MKIDKTYIPLLFFSCVALGIIIGGWINFPVANASFAKNDYKTKLNKLINFIDTEYVDDVKIDSIVDLTVTNILALDSASPTTNHETCTIKRHIRCNIFGQKPKIFFHVGWQITSSRHFNAYINKNCNHS